MATIYIYILSIWYIVNINVLKYSLFVFHTDEIFQENKIHDILKPS